MEIQDIKSRLSILEVLSHYNLKPNRNKMLCCPFHDDKKPSMQVYPETNTVHCFSGNCEQTGKAIDQIDFILHMESLTAGGSCTKHEAINKAKAIASPSNYPATAPKPVSATKPQNLSETFIKLQEGLKRSKSAQNYLQERNISTAEIGFNSKNTFNQMVQC